MTDQLQIMDLVVNAPLKAAIRRSRVQGLFNYFQSWKILRLQDEALPIDQRVYPPFAPPKPTLRTGLQSLISTLATTLSTPKFEQSMARAFVEACQAPKADGTFVSYTNHRRGTVVKQLTLSVLGEEGLPKNVDAEHLPLAAAFGDAVTRANAADEDVEEDGSSDEDEHEP